MSQFQSFLIEWYKLLCDFWGRRTMRLCRYLFPISALALLFSGPAFAQPEVEHGWMGYLKDRRPAPKWMYASPLKISVTGNGAYSLVTAD